MTTGDQRPEIAAEHYSNAIWKDVTQPKGVKRIEVVP